MRLPSVYGVGTVETVTVCVVVGFRNRDQPQALKTRSPPCGHGSMASHRGAPQRHAEPGNGARTYRLWVD